MESVKSKYFERILDLQIKDLNNLENKILAKEKIFEMVKASNYLYCANPNPKILLNYIPALEKLTGIEWISLHDALRNTITDWIHDTLDEDREKLEKINSKIQEL